MNLTVDLTHIAFSKTKIAYNFGLSECNGVKCELVLFQGKNLCHSVFSKRNNSYRNEFAPLGVYSFWNNDNTCNCLYL